MAHTTSEQVKYLANAVGFDSIGLFNAQDLVVYPEVREMCAANRCRSYNHNWCCPPACGDLEYFKTFLSKFDRGFVLQTVGKLEDEFDIETMQETERIQKDRTSQLQELVCKNIQDETLILSAGTCTLCKECAYPNPCRFPNKRMISMEAAGLWVTKVCEIADVPYNHGPLTIAYISCILFNEA